MHYKQIGWFARIMTATEPYFTTVVSLLQKKTLPLSVQWELIGR